MHAEKHSPHTATDEAVSEPTPRRNLTKARGERTREVILEEASALIAIQGYRGTSLRDISERVGISHPGMLHHFASKEVLLQSVLARTEALLMELIDSFVQAAQTPEGIRDWYIVSQYRSLMFAVVRAEAVDPDHPGRAAIEDIQVKAERKLTELFEMYERNGWLVPGVTPDWVARAIVAMWTGAFLRDGFMNDGIVEDDFSMFVRLFVVGVDGDSGRTVA